MASRKVVAPDYAAVRDDLSVIGDFGQPVGRFVEWNADGAWDVAGGVLIDRPDV